MATTISPAPVAIRQFDWDPQTRTLSAEMSSTRGLGRVYPDSCDEGLTVVGATGREVVFAISEEHTRGAGSDREVTHWTLTPADPADRRLVAAMILWND